MIRAVLWQSNDFSLIFTNYLNFQDRLRSWDKFHNSYQCFTIYYWLLYSYSTYLRSTWEIFTHMKTSPFLWRAANFDLCSAFMAIEQIRFFTVSHLLLHGASVYNGHPQGTGTLTSVAERLAVKLLLLFRSVTAASNTQFSACRANTLTDYARVGFQKLINISVIY